MSCIRGVKPQLRKSKGDYLHLISTTFHTHDLAAQSTNTELCWEVKGVFSLSVAVEHRAQNSDDVYLKGTNPA